MEMIREEHNRVPVVLITSADDTSTRVTLTRNNVLVIVVANLLLWL